MNSPVDPAPNDAPDGRGYRLVRFGSHAWKFTLRASLVALVVLLGIPLYAAIFDRSFVIGEFSVPEELHKSGVTSSVIGRLFFDRIAEMQRVASSAVTQSQLGTQAFGAEATTSRVADIKLPGADISLSLLVSQLRTLLGKQDTRIVGEIVVLKNAAEPRYVLRAHASGGDVWVESEEGTEVGALVSTVAERLVQRFDPLVAAFYYLRTPKPDQSNLTEAIGFADGFHSRDKRQQAWALVLRGLAWRDKGNAEETRASLCTAIDLDESFIPAWRILASSLRDDGAVDQAAYLARRLVRTQPSEPEGYRQLGALRDDCMAGDEERTRGVGFFKRALELGSHKPDYLSRVDYARFLYTWYQPVLSPAPDGFVNYMDLAAHPYLEQAEALAPDEPSVYTTWARILSHPQDEIRSEPEPSASETELKTRHAAVESRLLEAELKARYAMVRDSTSPEANLALGEVLTEQATELRNRLLQTSKFSDDDIPEEPTAHSKFLQAKEYLERARSSSAASASVYDAIYARALAGAGDLAGAEKILVEAETDDPHVLEWVHGEMLYNQKRYGEALEHLRAAEAVRMCGPRSNMVRNLIVKLEARLAMEHRAASAHAAAKAENKGLLAAAATGQTRAKSLSGAKRACPKWTEPEIEEPSP